MFHCFQELFQKWWLLSAMCLLTVMLNIDVTAVSIAIPAIAEDMHASLASMQWVINAFVLLPAIFTLLAGILGDQYGTKRLFLIAIGFFALGSILTGVAPNEMILIGGRVIQGLALGISYPISILLIYGIFPKKLHSVAIGYITATMGISLALGPTVGGIFVEYFSWRWIFFLNIPIALVCMIITLKTCPHDRARARLKKMDYQGLVVFVLGLFFLILALNQSQIWGLTSIRFIGSLLLGIALLIYLVTLEKAIRMPLIDMQLFKNRDFAIHNIIRFIVQIIFVPLLFFLPLYLENIAQYRAIQASEIMLSMTLVLGVLSVLSGHLVNWFGVKKINGLSMILLAVSCFLLLFVGKTPNLWLFCSALLIMGIAVSLSFVATTIGAVNAVPKHQSGLGSGIFFSVAWASIAFGVALIGGIIASLSSWALQNALVQQGVTLSEPQLLQAKRMAKGIVSTIGVDNPILLKSIDDAFFYGFRAALWFLVIAAIMGLVASFMLNSEKNQG